RNLPLNEADTTQLRQVALNLIANGAEAIGDTSGTLCVSTGGEDIDSASAPDTPGSDPIPPGRYVYFGGQDDGSGTDEETRGAIFAPFSTTRSSGRGLGLAAVLGIIRAHKGAVKVKSPPGAGTTVRVLLPAAEMRVPRPLARRPLDPSRAMGAVLVV